MQYVGRFNFKPIFLQSETQYLPTNSYGPNAQLGCRCEYSRCQTIGASSVVAYHAYFSLLPWRSFFGHRFPPHKIFWLLMGCGKCVVRFLIHHAPHAVSSALTQLLSLLMVCQDSRLCNAGIYDICICHWNKPFHDVKKTKRESDKQGSDFKTQGDAPAFRLTHTGSFLRQVCIMITVPPIVCR